MSGVSSVVVRGSVVHESYVPTLTIYADYIDETEGGKAVSLARPTAPDPTPID